jgi:hypothetical protein
MAALIAAATSTGLVRERNVVFGAVERRLLPAEWRQFTASIHANAPIS